MSSKCKFVYFLVVVVRNQYNVSDTKQPIFSTSHILEFIGRDD